MEAVLIGRGLFGICLGLSWLNSMTHILQSEEMIYTRGIQRRLWAHPAWKWLIPTTIPFVLSCYLFCAGLYEVPAGIVIVGAIFWIRRWEISLWHNNIVVNLGKYSPSGTCLIAYLAGYAIAPYFNLDPQSTGVEVACGGLGAAWFLSGWKKIEYSGWNWMGKRNIGLLLAERAYIGNKWFRTIRRQLIRSPFALRTIGFLGVFLEMAGIIFCFPEYRIAYAVIINLLLLGTVVLLGYYEPEWMLIIIALAIM